MGIIGLISGAIGSLIAPWAKFGVEKAKARLLNRRRFIHRIKKKIEIEEFDFSEFMNSSEYSVIKEHLSKDTINEIEGISQNKLKIQTAIRGEGANNFKYILLDAVHELEKKWKLI